MERRGQETTRTRLCTEPSVRVDGLAAPYRAYHFAAQSSAFKRSPRMTTEQFLAAHLPFPVQIPECEIGVRADADRPFARIQAENACGRRGGEFGEPTQRQAAAMDSLIQ